MLDLCVAPGADVPAEAFDDRHPGWSWVDLQGVGHVPTLEAPTATAAAIVGTAP